MLNDCNIVLIAWWLTLGTCRASHVELTTQADMAELVKTEVTRLETKMEDNAVKVKVPTPSVVSHIHTLNTRVSCIVLLSLLTVRFQDDHLLCAV
jgi:hypothetical protein